MSSNPIISIRTTGLDEVRRALAAYPAQQRKALRNAINDTARDVQKRIQGEVNRSFDRPTPKIQKAFYVYKATEDNLKAEVRINDKYGRGTGRAIPNTIEPHVPEFPRTRSLKGMEIVLQRKGLLRRGQYLVPSRTMPRDSYGNIKGSTASKMLSDLWVWSGDDATRNTGSGSSRRRATYIFGTIHPRGGSPVTGIWHRARFLAGAGGALMMIVTNRTPQYSPRFDFFAVGNQEIDDKLPHHARLAIEHALRRSGIR